MPAVITHTLCAYHAYNRLADANPLSAGPLSSHRAAYAMGAQGPDVFFFCFLPPGGPAVPPAGNLLHREGAGEFFRQACIYISKQPERAKEILYALLSGYLCHYALDSLAHPFVYYHTGFGGDADHFLAAPFAAHHRRMEADIDTLLCLRYAHKTPYEWNIPRRLKLTGEEQELFTDFYTEMLCRAYCLSFPRHKLTSLGRGLPAVYGFFRDAGGGKKTALSFAEQIITKNQTVSAMVHRPNLPAGPNEPDPLKLDKTLWFNPWDISRPRHESFLDLFYRASKLSAQYTSALYQTVYRQEPLPDALALFGDRSMTSGQAEPVVFRYYNCLYDPSLKTI